MNELEEFKKSLGPAAKEYTNPQLLRLQMDMDELCQILLEFYLQKRGVGEKNHAGSTDDFDTISRKE